jgi:hypothetical protein
MMTPMEVRCPICGQSYDWHHGYGQLINCCGRECFKEAEWRYTLSILGKEYRPQEQKERVS